MFRERCIEFLQYVGNLLHFLVRCKCIVCPKKYTATQNRTNIEVVRAPFIIPSDFEDGSIYNGSSIYGVPPVRARPTTAVTSTNTPGITISTKSLTAANDETYMHAVKVEFTCEVKGMIEVGGVPKEVKGMISIMNNAEKSIIEGKPAVIAVNKSVNQRLTEEPDYLEPIDKRVEREVDDIYDEIKILPGQSSTSSLPRSQGLYDGGYGSNSSRDTRDYGETNIYENTQAITDDELDNISQCSSWSGDADQVEPVYGNSNVILKNKLENILSRQTSNVTSTSNQARKSMGSVNTHVEVNNVERNYSKSETKTIISSMKIEETTEEEDENIYEDVVVKDYASGNQRY